MEILDDGDILADQPRDFCSFLKDHRKGRCLSDLSYQLQDLVFHVMEFDKPGSITLKLTVRPTDEKTADHLLIVTDTIDVKAPKADDVSQYFFADHNGNLSLSNPDQMIIPGLHQAKDMS